MTNATRTLIATLWLIGVVSPASGSPCQLTKTLSVPVAEFHAHKLNRVEALLKLGQENKICFGIGYIEKNLLSEVIDIDLENTTIEATVNRMFPPQKGFTVVEQDGAVNIENINLPPARENLFKFVVPVFKTTRRASVQDNSNAVQVQLFLVLNPDAKGIAGHYRPGDEANVAGPFDEQGKAIQELLNSIVVHSTRGAMWIATVSAKNLSSLPPSGIWAVLDYSQPVDDYRPLLSRIATNLPE